MLKKESYRYVTEIVIAVVIISIAIFYGFYFKINDLKETKRTEATVTKIERLRNALEEYYKLTGTYPELTKEGAYNDLSILDIESKAGEKISFAKIYGKNKLESTETSGRIKSSNKVYDVSDFNKVTNDGGWNYNYSQRTGEIHANLPVMPYYQNMNWSEQ